MQPMTTYTRGDLMISSPNESLVLELATLSIGGKPAAIAAAANDIPALGAYWPGQGGVNGGFVPARGDVPAHYLIFAAKDVGDHEWGGRSKESGATSKWDGKANTDVLIAEGGHPAAEAARAYTADGHDDFDLPAAAQLHQAWAHDLIKEGAYWSSSQRSADYAFLMTFDDGGQGYYAKDNELRVRPVRRLIR